MENAWGLDATSYGNHEFDYGVARLQAHQARADFPFLATNIVETATGKAPSWVRPSQVFTVNGVKVGVIGAASGDHARTGVAGRNRRADLPAGRTAHQGRVAAAAEAAGSRCRSS